jgi:hypothetical protein
MLQFVAKRCFKSQEEANGCAELTAGGAGKAERTKRRARGFKRSSAQDEGRQSDLAGERQRRHESRWPIRVIRKGETCSPADSVTSIRPNE